MPTSKPPASSLEARSRYVSIGGQAQAIAAGIGSRGDLCLLASCGHTLHREAPHRTLELMRRFILNARGSLAPAATDSGNSC